jgi:hypothetical protein
MTWLSLHPTGMPLHAYGITVEAGEGASAPGQFLRACPEEPARVGRAAIDLGPGRVQVKIDGADVWNGQLVPSRRFPEAEFPGILDRLYRCVSGVPVCSPFLEAVDGSGTDLKADRTGVPAAIGVRAAVLVDEIEVSWRAQSVADTLEAAKRIVGLGFGLTPSGDDFLAGFLGAAFCFANADAFRKEVFDSMRSVIHRTTLPSFFMLRAALGGFYSEPLAALLISLMTGKADDLDGAIKALIALGATSGQDVLAGVLSYLQISSLCGTAHAAH